MTLEDFYSGSCVEGELDSCIRGGAIWASLRRDHISDHFITEEYSWGDRVVGCPDVKFDEVLANFGCGCCHGLFFRVGVMPCGGVDLLDVYVRVVDVIMAAADIAIVDGAAHSDIGMAIGQETELDGDEGESDEERVGVSLPEAVGCSEDPLPKGS